MYSLRAISFITLLDYVADETAVKRINRAYAVNLCLLYLIRVEVENKELALSARSVASSRKSRVRRRLAQRHEERLIMAATGELIRLINYVDDINTTLRRIHASLYGMEADERKKLAEALRNADSKLRELLEQVEK
jgi:hypothetical protein